MSGICGVFRFDGGPVDGALLERMIDRIAWRGPEGRGRWVGPGAALGFTRFATTPEAAAETQPLLDPESGLVLVLDGRIDNREEVLASLRQRGAAPREPSDAGILLAAWKAMGEACLLRLAGDYALLLWDGRRRRLVAARDPLGIRPLFRASAGGALLLASDPLSLLAHPALPAEPAEGYLAEILAEEARSWEETLHRGVLRVPPGHLLEAGEGGARLRLAFDPTPLPRPPGASLATDAEAFRAVFDEAVRCRLRVPPGGKAPGILLSGGVDSGAVALAAAGIRAAEGGGRGDLLAVSGVFPGEPFDEEPLIRETAAAAGIGLLRGLPVEVPPGEPAREAAATGALPLSPLGRTHYLLLAAAGGAGRRVLLTGNGGDEWPGGTPYLLSTVLARREAGAFLRLLRRRGAARGLLGAGRDALQYGLRPLVPEAARRAIRLLVPRPPRGAPWVHPEFRRRVDLDGRRRRRFDPGPGVPHPSRALLLRAVSGWWQEAWEYNDRISSRAGVEMRHPFQDLRLIRLCLGLPPESLWDGVRTKAVLREALRGRVPEDLRLRDAKPHATALEVRLLGAMARRDGTGFRRLEARGWVDAPVLGAMARRLREGACEGSDRGMEEALVVGKALALESWLGSMGPDGPPPEGGWEGEEA